MNQEAISKMKDYSIAMIDIQETTMKSSLDAFRKFAGHDFTTYTSGASFIVSELSRYARKTVEDAASFVVPKTEK